MPSGSIPHDQQRIQKGKRHVNPTGNPLDFPGRNALDHQESVDDSFELEMARKFLPAFVAIPARILTDNLVDFRWLRLYSLICAFTNTEGKLVISLKTLTLLAGYREVSVIQHINGLIKLGYLGEDLFDE